MIELNEKTQQDFLGREWVHRLLDAGVDMSDAKYWIVNCIDSLSGGRKDYVVDDSGLLKVEPAWCDKHGTEKRLLNKKPTYTVTELLYKLHEHLDKFPSIYGSIDILSCVSFVCDVDDDNHHKILFCGSGPQSYIGQLASLLIQCHQKGIGIKSKDTEDISDK